MLKKDLSGGGNPRGNSWARVCDTCQLAPCSVYCKADAAYLCTACDARIHAANQLASRHDRVWVCEACERAPAAFLCKADAASLCADCDADIHSANPLARRHHRVPILPLSSSSATNPGCRNGAAFPMAEDGFDDEDEDEAASWLLLNQPSTKESKINNDDNNNNTNGCFLGGEVDEYLDLVEYTSGADNCQISDENYGHQYDSVVPVGIGEEKLDGHDHHNFYDIKLGYAYNGASVSHSVSVSSLDAGVVPESSSMMSDMSTSTQRPPKGTIDLFSSAPLQQTPTQLSPMDREARVMRYREKKKTRKFEKTIRYASRKAYAETRPRIKGRFAKRADVEVEEMFPNSIMGDGGYGIVPSF